MSGFLRSNCDKANVLLQPYIALSSYARIRSQQEIDELEARLTEHEARISQMNNSQETLKKRFLELTELRHVLRETAHFFDEVSFSFFCFTQFLSCNFVSFVMANKYLFRSLF